MSNVKKFVVKLSIAGGILALIASTGFGAINYIGRTALQRQYASKEDELAKANKRNLELRSAHDQDQRQIADQQRELEQLRPDNTTMKESIGAFAIQAAACEALRQSINAKGPGV